MKKIITMMVAVAVSSLAAIAQPYPTTDNIVRLTDQNMPAVEFFTLEKVKLPEKYANAQYFVYNDSVLIIINNQRPQPYVVTFYNLNTQKETELLTLGLLDISKTTLGACVYNPKYESRMGNGHFCYP